MRINNPFVGHESENSVEAFTPEQLLDAYSGYIEELRETAIAHHGAIDG